MPKKTTSEKIEISTFASKQCVKEIEKCKKMIIKLEKALNTHDEKKAMLEESLSETKTMLSELEKIQNML